MLGAAPLLAGAMVWPGPTGAADSERLGFDELYSGWGVTGLRFSDKVGVLVGRRVAITGFMAPPLKADAGFFVLAREPMSLCPFCSSDAEWPADIVVVYLRRDLVPARFDEPVEAAGVLEAGSWTDPDTGFVSQLRLRDAAVRRG